MKWADIKKRYPNKFILIGDPDIMSRVCQMTYAPDENQACKSAKFRRENFLSDKYLSRIKL